MRQMTPDTGEEVSGTYGESLTTINERIIGILLLSAVMPHDAVLELELQQA
jgi:hypothetical protein